MSVRMSPEEYQQLQAEQADEEARQLTAEEFKGPHEKYDRALAIDPGTTSGLAWTDGDRIKTWSSSFWSMAGEHYFSERPGSLALDTDTTAILLEAPWQSAVGKNSHTRTAIAYRSGQVAREAKLLHERLVDLGYDVSTFDPSRASAKWDSKYAHHLLGEWAGPDNEHTRDALRLLVYYNFV